MAQQPLHAVQRRTVFLSTKLRVLPMQILTEEIVQQDDY